MYEMWKREHIHGHVRKIMYRTKILEKKLGNMEKTTFVRPSLVVLQKVFGIREAKNGSETDELLQNGTDGHQRIWQHVEENSNSRSWWFFLEGLVGESLRTGLRLS